MTDGWAVTGAVAGVVGAGAAILAVWYARQAARLSTVQLQRDRDRERPEIRFEEQRLGDHGLQVWFLHLRSAPRPLWTVEVHLLNPLEAKMIRPGAHAGARAHLHHRVSFGHLPADKEQEPKLFTIVLEAGRHLDRARIRTVLKRENGEEWAFTSILT